MSLAEKQLAMKRKFASDKYAPSLRLEIRQERVSASESYRLRLDAETIVEIQQLAESEQRTMHNMMIVLLRRGLRK